MKKRVISLVLAVTVVLLSVASAFAASAYTVKPGDVLWKIAASNGTTWQKLAELNKLANPHLIFPNQVLQLSGEAAAPAAAVPAPAPAAPVPAATPAPAEADAVATASLPDTNTLFEKGIAANGVWIITPLTDLTFDKELVVEGTFKNGKKAADGSDAVQRKIGLYTQDDAHKTTGRFTLTAPKLTFNSPNGSLEKGTFIGDLYIGGDNFQLKDQVVIGNVVFTTESAKATFKKDATSIVFGREEYLPGAEKVDTVATASLPDTNALFLKGIAADGDWIITPLTDLTFDKPLVVDGVFKNGKKDATTGAELYQRKIGLYTQNDAKKTTSRFTLAAPSITFNSPFGSLEKGTFRGDVYVSADNFQLKDQVIIGNLIFTNESAKATFKKDATSIVTGREELLVVAPQVDVVATASLPDTNALFEKGIAADGKWIITPLTDLFFKKALTVDGVFKNGKKDATTGAELYQRKIGLYTQDDAKKTTGRFTLSAPRLTFNSPKGSLEKGTFVGDVYVGANDFQLKDQVIIGSLIFTTQSAKDTFKADATSKVVGRTEVILP